MCISLKYAKLGETGRKTSTPRSYDAIRRVTSSLWKVHLVIYKRSVGVSRPA